MNTLVTILRWIARIISILAILLFGLMFLQDGLPLFLFADDDPELAFHMWALFGMLISLGFGWKWEGLSAALTLLFFIADEIALLKAKVPERKALMPVAGSAKEYPN